MDIDFKGMTENQMKEYVLAFIQKSKENIVCEYCGKRWSDHPKLDFHKDHIVPRQFWGSDEPENMADACSDCNYSKGSSLNMKTLSGRAGHSFYLKFIDGIWHLPYHGL